MFCKLTPNKVFKKVSALGLHLIFKIISEDNRLTILTLPVTIHALSFQSIRFSLNSPYFIDQFLFIIFLCGMWYLDSVTRDRTPTPCTGKQVTKPLDHQRNPSRIFYSFQHRNFTQIWTFHSHAFVNINFVFKFVVIVAATNRIVPNDFSDCRY